MPRRKSAIVLAKEEAKARNEAGLRLALADVVADGATRGDPAGVVADRIIDILQRYRSHRVRLSLEPLRKERRLTGPAQHLPYGYRVDANGFVVEDPAECAAIARAIALRAEGLTYYRIAVVLENEGHKPRPRRKAAPTTPVPAPSGRKKRKASPLLWHIATVMRIVRDNVIDLDDRPAPANPLYL